MVITDGLSMEGGILFDTFCVVNSSNNLSCSMTEDESVEIVNGVAHLYYPDVKRI